MTCCCWWSSCRRCCTVPKSVAAKIYWSGFPFGQGLANRLSDKIGYAYVIDNGLWLATASLCLKVISNTKEVVVAEEQEKRCSLHRGRWTKAFGDDEHADETREEH